MIELQLQDGRILQFRSGKRTRHQGAGTLKEQDITAVAVDGLSVSERSSRGVDFLLSEKGNPSPRLAVEVKRNTGRPQTQSTQDKLTRYANDMFKQFGKDTQFQLWLVSPDASSIEVSTYSPERGFGIATSYHLADVSTRASQAIASSDQIVARRTEIDTAHVTARIDDWEQRIRGLYKTVEIWCENIPNIETNQQTFITMDEDMMRRYAVPPRNLPVFQLLRDSVSLLTFKPYGLWIIGANGRIDIFSYNASFFIIDLAEQFEPPVWKLFGSSEKRIRNKRLASGVDFTPEALGVLVGG